MQQEELQPTIHIGENERRNSREEEMVSNIKKLPRFKKLEIVFEMIALVILIVTWTYFNKIFNDLPQQVPTDFDFGGEVQRKADKNFLYALPVFDTIVYILITILQFVPHKLKYDCIRLTVFNAHNIYRATRIVMLYIKIITELLFAYITFTLLSVVQMQSSAQNMYFAFLFIIPFLIGSYVYYRYVKNMNIDTCQM
ncbi:hypothetical protein pb186bvf_007101 [Paramecium bursaria]